jgi:hypothetical protein
MWRSCGTYIWNKFRNIESLYAYYEPCHEELVHQSAEGMERMFNGGKLLQVLRHPFTERNYFAEFPFQASGGVKFFKKRFSYEHFHMAPSDSDEELEQYIGFLVDYAYAHDRRPIAKFCRFGLRSAWMKRVFAPISLYVMRDPDAMFRSYWSLGGTRSYYVLGSILIVSKNRDSVPFRDIAAEFSIPAIDRPTFQEELHEVHELSRRMNVQAIRDIVGCLWALTLSHNAMSCDLIIDIDLAAQDLLYRTEVENGIQEQAGVRVSFDDIVRPDVPQAPGTVLSERGRELSAHAIRTCEPDVDLSGIRMSDASRRVIERLL